MLRTYVDASVLIAAFRGDSLCSRRAMEVLEDPNCKLEVSDFLRLEVLPKPAFNKRKEEVQFMEEVLKSAAEEVPCDSKVTEEAIKLGSHYDLVNC